MRHIPTLQDYLNREHDERADERWGAVGPNPAEDADTYPSEALEACTWVTDDEDELPPGVTCIENEMRGGLGNE